MNGAATLDAHMEAVKQVAVADRIVLTKTDLLDTPERRAPTEPLDARLRALNPAAPILDAAAGEATPARLLDCGLFDPERKIPDVKRWLAAEAYAARRRTRTACITVITTHDVNRHDERIRAFSLATDDAIPAGDLRHVPRSLRSMHGPNLLRLKGIVKLAESRTSPLVIHGVQHVFHPPVRLPRWPDGDQRTRIVLITRDLEPRAVSACSTRSWAPPRPTSPIARRCSTIRWCRSAASTADGPQRRALDALPRSDPVPDARETRVHESRRRAV